MNKKILLVIAVFAAAALTARAQNLVTNPGFETGDFTGWTQFGDTGDDGVSGQSPDGTLPHSGNFLAWFGNFTADGGITQTLTSSATTFNVDFYLAAGQGGAGDYFMVDLGSAGTIYSLAGNGQFGYIHVVIDNVVAGTNPVLAIHTFNAPSWWDLDDVTVTAVVPEPGTLGLIALGALGLVGALRKRLV
jgi:hypothetical protein